MAEPFDDAIDRQRREIGIAAFDQHQAGFCRTHFSDRRSDRTRQSGPARDCGLHGWRSGRDSVDQVGIDKER